MEPAWISELREIFFTEDVEKLDIPGAIALKQKHIPKRLFKYREFKESSLRGLREDTLWCTFADQFNDPYDCALTYDPYFGMEYGVYLARNLEGLSEADIELVRSASDPLKQLVDLHFQKGPEHLKSFAEKFYDVMNQRRISNQSEMVKAMCEAIRKQHRICALSERVDSILMWGHYSMNHTGFAIEYDFTPNQGLCDISHYVWPVVYSEKLYDASYIFKNLRDDGYAFNNLFGIVASLHKGMDWSYEHEWRIVIPDGDVNPAGAYKVPKATAIHLGAKMDEAHKLKLVKEAEMKNIAVYQMRLAQHEFRLESVLL